MGFTNNTVAEVRLNEQELTRSIEMSEEWKDRETQLFELLRESGRYWSENKVINECKDLNDDGTKHVIDALKKRPQIFIVNGFYKYIEMTQRILEDIIDILSEALKGTYIDTSVEYDIYKDEFMSLGIINSQELHAILHKFITCAPCSVSTYIRSEAILAWKAHPSGFENESLPKITEKEVRFDISKILTASYERIGDIETKYFRYVGKHIDSQDLCLLLDQYPYSVSKFPHNYRMINVSDEELRSLLSDAASKLKVKRAPGSVIYGSVKEECYRNDIRLEMEFDQVISKRVPDVLTPVSREYDLFGYADDAINDVKEGTDDTLTIPEDALCQLRGGVHKKDVVVLSDEGISNSILNEMSSHEYFTSSMIRSRLIDRFDSMAIKNGLNSLAGAGLIFITDQGYRLPSGYSAEKLKDALGNYHDCIRTAKRIMSECGPAMSSMDIRTAQELCSCIEFIGRAYVIDRSSGMISFDGMGFDEYLSQRYDAHDENKANFPYVFEAETGVHSDFVKERLRKNGIAIYPERAVGDDKNLIPFSSIFTKKFYLKDEFYDILRTKRPDLEGNRLSKSDLDKLGYVQNEDIIYSKEYPLPYSAFLGTLRGQTNLELPKEYLKNKTVHIAMVGEQLNNNWLCYEEGSYIHISKLNSIGVNKDTIERYIKRIRSFYCDRCFTLQLLKKDGINDLDLLGFTDPIFYDSILRPRFKYVNVDGVLLYNAVRAPRIGTVLEQIIGNSEYMDVSDVLDILEKDYGIKKDRKSIMKSIYSTEMFHDADSELVFKNKESMIKFAKREDHQEDEQKED